MSEVNVDNSEGVPGEGFPQNEISGAEEEMIFHRMTLESNQQTAPVAPVENDRNAEKKQRRADKHDFQALTTSNIPGALAGAYDAAQGNILQFTQNVEDFFKEELGLQLTPSKIKNAAEDFLRNMRPAPDDNVIEIVAYELGELLLDIIMDNFDDISTPKINGKDVHTLSQKEVFIEAFKESMHYDREVIRGMEPEAKANFDKALNHLAEQYVGNSKIKGAIAATGKNGMRAVHEAARIADQIADTLDHYSIEPDGTVRDVKLRMEDGSIETRDLNIGDPAELARFARTNFLPNHAYAMVKGPSEDRPEPTIDMMKGYRAEVSADVTSRVKDLQLAASDLGALAGYSENLLSSDAAKPERGKIHFTVVQDEQGREHFQEVYTDLDGVELPLKRFDDKYDDQSLDLLADKLQAIQLIRELMELEQGLSQTELTQNFNKMEFKDRAVDANPNLSRDEIDGFTIELNVDRMQLELIDPETDVVVFSQPVGMQGIEAIKENILARTELLQMESAFDHLKSDPEMLVASQMSLEDAVEKALGSDVEFKIYPDQETGQIMVEIPTQQEVIDGDGNPTTVETTKTARLDAVLNSAQLEALKETFEQRAVRVRGRGSDGPDGGIEHNLADLDLLSRESIQEALQKALQEALQGSDGDPDGPGGGIEHNLADLDSLSRESIQEALQKALQEANNLLADANVVDGEQPEREPPSPTPTPTRAEQDTPPKTGGRGI